MVDKSLNLHPQAQAAVDRLGGPVRIFRASLRRLGMGLFVVVAAVGFGIYSIHLAETGQFGPSKKDDGRRDLTPEEKRENRIGGDCLGGVAIVGGLCFAYWLYRTSKRQIALCRDGLVVLAGSEIRPLAWNEIESLDACRITTSPFKGILSFVVKGTYYAYTVIPRDGREIRFNRDTIGKSAELYDLLKSQAQVHGIPIAESPPA